MLNDIFETTSIVFV